MKRVLIIGADFTPSSHPPALRIRFFIQHLREFGWEPIVLTVDPSCYENVIDPENEELLPDNIEVIRTLALPANWTRLFGFSDLGFRTLWHHWRALSILIKRLKIDLIFIPVPPNPSMLLGRLAHARFGIPYVIDYIDPVATEYYWKLPRSQRPPKYALAYAMERLMERFAIANVAQITGVSRGTTDSVIARYPWLKNLATEIPYGGEPADFDHIRRHPRKNVIFNSGDGFRHVSYIGAYPLSMAPVLRALFAGIAQARSRNPEQFSRVRVHFVGTRYASSRGQQEQVRSIAAELGIADLVDEHPDRVPYLDALNLLLDSNALLVVGSVEPHYTASKIFPYILAEKPLLPIFHERSSVVQILADTGAEEAITFSDEHPLSQTVEKIAISFQRLLDLPPDFRQCICWEEFESYTTRAMSAQLARVFDKAAKMPPFSGATITPLVFDKSE
jgi:Glycosyl transferase 4-like domain